jgi:hypothetical protein
MPRDVPPPLEL